MQDDLVALEMLEAHLGIKVLDLGGDQDLEILSVKAASSPTPTWARRHPAQKSATVVPMGVTAPIPVTTTRRGPPETVI